MLGNCFDFPNLLLWEKLGSTCQHSKELQMSKPVSVQAEFISDAFSWKRAGCAEVGVQAKSLGKSKGGKRHQVPCFEDLHSGRGSYVLTGG